MVHSNSTSRKTRKTASKDSQRLMPQCHHQPLPQVRPQLPSHRRSRSSTSTVRIWSREMLWFNSTTLLITRMLNTHSHMFTPKRVRMSTQLLDSQSKSSRDIIRSNHQCSSFKMLPTKRTLSTHSSTFIPRRVKTLIQSQDSQWRSSRATLRSKDLVLNSTLETKKTPNIHSLTYTLRRVRMLTL